MVDASRHDHEIAFLQPDAHPIIVLASDIKVAATSENVSNLLVFMQMLVEEVLDLLLVARQGARANLDLVSVLVMSLSGNLVDRIEVVWEFKVLYA